ncbi:Green-sensitive opsin [Trichoplax sp. H2]|nr:Green-sensitive opsin [Trichoplax sp. H2]|eukprot:RDD36429.1 Green-sensitive opsin [Trichoplax sp. H2]
MVVSNNSSNFTTNNNAYVAFYSKVFIGVTGFILNMSVGLIICTHSALRQPFTYLILNLSISDLLVSLTLLVNGILDYYTIASFTTYQNAYILCTVNVAIVLTSMPGACLTLLVMSFERYQAVAAVRLRNIKFTTVLKIILITWLAAISSAIIPTYYATFYNHYPSACTIGRIDNYTLLVISIILFSTTCILPIIVMLIMYGLIIYKLIYEKSAVEIGLSFITNNRGKNIRSTILPVLLTSIFTTAPSIPYILLSYYTLIKEYYNPYFREPFMKKIMVFGLLPLYCMC